MQATPKKDASNADREHLIERVIDAPAAFVFQAWTTPEHVRQWFGPKPWNVTHCELDFRVGGKWRMQMTGPGGEKGPFFGGAYVAIVPNDTITFTNAFEAPGSPTMTMTATFRADGSKTRFRLLTVFESAAHKSDVLSQGFHEGSGVMCDQMTAVAEALAR